MHIDTSNIANLSLTLSDGTPVTFSKLTSKGNIQVRLPDSHPFTNGDPLRIFRPDGTHYKDLTDLTLVAAVPAAPAAAQISAFSAEVSYQVGDFYYATLEDAKDEALDLFRETGDTMTIYAHTRKAVAKVGFVDLG